MPANKTPAIETIQFDLNLQRALCCGERAYKDDFGFMMVLIK